MGAALARLRVHWMRYVLTILQVGVAVMVVTSVVTNLLPAVWRLTKTAPPTLFEVEYARMAGNTLRSQQEFIVDDVAYLEEFATSIEAVSVVNRTSVELLRVGEHRYAASGVAHVSPAYAAAVELRLTRGRFFTSHEAGGVQRVGVISEEWAQVLFGSVDPVGQVINIRPREEAQVLSGAPLRIDFQATQAALGTDIEIIGVFAREEKPGGAGEAEDHLLLPARKFMLDPLRLGPQGVTIRTSEPLDEKYMWLLVKARPDMHQYVEAELQALLMPRLQQRIGSSTAGDELRVRPVGAVDQVVSDTRLRERTILAVSGLAALIVAGFAVFATTMAGLAQRMQSIGLARSLGATRGRVVGEAIAEAGLVAAVGGILGVLAAYPVGQYLLTSLEIGVQSVDFTWIHAGVAALLSVVLGVGIGILAAVYPAWSVAKLMPTEALREGRG